MILGRDFMQAYGIDIRFSNATIEWDSKVIPFSDADDVLRMLRSSDPQSDCRWRRPRTQSRYIYPPGHPIREALNRERAAWERRKLLLWLQNEYQRSFNRTIERHTSNNCKLHTVEGVHLHTNTANSHEHSASIEMEINRLQRLGVLQRSTMPQRSVSASSLRPNNPERGHMRSIEDGTIGSPTRHSFEFETPPFEFINRGLMLTTFTMDTAEGFRNTPQAAHYDVPVNKGPMGIPMAPSLFFDTMSTTSLPGKVYTYVDNVCCVSYKPTPTVGNIHQLFNQIRNAFQMKSYPVYVPSPPVDATDVKARIPRPLLRRQPPLIARATSHEASCSGKSTTCRTPDGVHPYLSLHVTTATDIRARIFLFSAIWSQTTSETQNANTWASTDVDATDIRARIRYYGSRPQYTIGNVRRQLYPHEHFQSPASPEFEATDIRDRIPHAGHHAASKTRTKVFVTSTMIRVAAPIITTTPAVTANALKRATRPCDKGQATNIRARIPQIRLQAAPDRRDNRLDELLRSFNNCTMDRDNPFSASALALHVAHSRVLATDIRDRIQQRRL